MDDVAPVVTALLLIFIFGCFGSCASGYDSGLSKATEHEKTGYCAAAADLTERECRVIGNECQCANGAGWETVKDWGSDD